MLLLSNSLQTAKPTDVFKVLRSDCILELEGVIPPPSHVQDLVTVLLTPASIQVGRQSNPMGLINFLVGFGLVR